MVKISLFLRIFIAFLSISLLFLSFNLISLSLSVIFIFTVVAPSFFTKSRYFYQFPLIDLILKTISLTGLLKRSLSEAIF